MDGPFFAADAYGCAYTRRGTASPVGNFTTRSSTATNDNSSGLQILVAAEGREVRMQP
jgi:hypothetical protein